MKKVLSLFTCLALALAQSATASHSPSGTGPGELTPAGVFGGALVDPVLAGNHVHVASGRILSTWDYTDPAQPVLLGNTAMMPADGVIRGLTRWGDYLYASWVSGRDTGGIAIYSLRDPARPQLVNQTSNYGSSYKDLWSVAAVNGYLYLFDAENGIYFGDLAANPTDPTFTLMVRTPVPYSRSQVVGNFIYASGKTIAADQIHVCSIIDATVPSAPVFLDNHCGNGEGLENFRSRIQWPYAAAFGVKFSLYDISTPGVTQVLGSIDTDAATDGFLWGQHAYGFGFGEMSIHDISDPAAPQTVSYSPIDTLGTDSVTALAGGALILTSTDRFIRLDVSKDPLSPTETSVATPIAGAVPRDIALRAGKALILQENYGIGIADPATFAPLGRFDAALPMALNQRDFEQFAVVGDRAYLAGWGFGLIVVELGFERPFELGRLEYPYVSTIAAAGNFVYLGTTTNGGILQVVDVSVPEKPTMRGALTLPTLNRIQVHGNYVYAADELSGVHVIDVSNPDAPVGVRVWNDGCANAGGYSARDIALNADGALAVVGCPTGLHILDLSRADSPTRIAHYPAEWADATVAIHDDRAWYADVDGLKAFDISTPASPRLVGQADLAGFAPRRLRAPGDGRVFAFGAQTGMHVFGETAASGDDRIFANGFDSGTGNGAVSTYDDLTEGFKGTSFHYNGVTYREVNEVAGVMPDGETFQPGNDPNGLGNEFIVEDATFLFNDFPDFGSSPNALTFGNSVIEGPNLTIGPLASAWLDLDEVATSASLEMLYFEYGPWEGIVLHVDALRNGKVVASQTRTIEGNGNPQDRDRLTTAKFTLSGAEFDSLHIHARWGKDYTAPRVMIDNLTLTPAAR